MTLESIETPTSFALTVAPEPDDPYFKLKVFLDGKEVGKVQQGMRGVFPVDPGFHEISVEGEWGILPARSTLLAIRVHAGQIKELHCGPLSLFDHFPRNIVLALRMRSFYVIRECPLTKDDLQKLILRRRRSLRLPLIPVLVAALVGLSSALWRLLFLLAGVILTPFSVKIANILQIVIFFAGSGVMVYVFILALKHLWRWANSKEDLEDFL
jgi:hypothetical protein